MAFRSRQLTNGDNLGTSMTNALLPPIRRRSAFFLSSDLPTTEQNLISPRAAPLTERWGPVDDTEVVLDAVRAAGRFRCQVCRRGFGAFDVDHAFGADRLEATSGCVQARGVVSESARDRVRRGEGVFVRHMWGI